jgi:hypothetical protein
MILDAIIGLFGSLFGLLVECIAAAFVPLVNLIAAGIEAVVGILVSGFSLGRVQRKKRDRATTGSAVGGILTLVAILCLIGWVVVAPKVMNRKVTLVAKDGHSLPFAALIVHTDDGDRHERTDKAGNIVIPRFGTRALTVKDPRYIEQRWEKSGIESQLVVGRTTLGSSLDSFASKLLKPSKK